MASPVSGASDTEAMPRALSLRCVAVSVFIASSTLNFLDRQLLNTLAPLILAEFHLNQTGFGFIVSVFSFAYASSSLAVGWLLDKFGVNRAMSWAVAWWSVSATAAAFVRSFGGLAVCRACLGVGESAGVPAVGKVNGVYLKPEERALGAALNQVGISLGLAAAPLFIGLAIRHSWRVPFTLVGMLGFVWIPVWLFVNRRIRPTFEISSPSRPNLRMLLDGSLLALVLSNILWMGGYSLWSNWTTLYLIHVHGITLAQSARYVWIPPLVSNLGGFFGGWLSKRLIERGVPPVAARRRAVWWSAAGYLLTLLLPLAPSAEIATALISVSFFFALAGSVNIYAIPIDLFGAGRSGLGIAALVFAYGFLQTLISPVIGYLSDRGLYTQVVWLIVTPAVLGAVALQPIREADAIRNAGEVR
jgi:ACS family hexuronate transporter-like MFS transporter